MVSSSFSNEYVRFFCFQVMEHYVKTRYMHDSMLEHHQVKNTLMTWLQLQVLKHSLCTKGRLQGGKRDGNTPFSKETILFWLKKTFCSPWVNRNDSAFDFFDDFLVSPLNLTVTGFASQIKSTIEKSNTC